jgi:hypothetical protein
VSNPFIPLPLNTHNGVLFVKVNMKASVKQCIALSLLGLMLVKAWVIPLLYLDFEIRRDYIVANLCENRSRPQLNCNGKCYLAKRIAETRKQEERQAEQDYMANLIYQVMNVRENNYFSAPSPAFNMPLTPYFDYKSPFTPSSVVDDIFHPPLG